MATKTKQADLEAKKKAKKEWKNTLNTAAEKITPKKPISTGVVQEKIDSTVPMINIDHRVDEKEKGIGSDLQATISNFSKPLLQEHKKKIPFNNSIFKDVKLKEGWPLQINYHRLKS